MKTPFALCLLQIWGKKKREREKKKETKKKKEKKKEVSIFLAKSQSAVLPVGITLKSVT